MAVHDGREPPVVRVIPASDASAARTVRKFFGDSRMSSTVVGSRRQESLSVNDHVAVAGMGLMGKSIVSCLVSCGHRKVSAITRDLGRTHEIKTEVHRNLHAMKDLGLITVNPGRLMERLEVTNYDSDRRLDDCALAIESGPESVEKKQAIISLLENMLPDDAVIGINTSSLRISDIQSKARHPERVVGTHFAEPAYSTYFLEVTCGDKTSPDVAQRMVELAETYWRKEPCLLRMDIPGGIANRLMYAMMIEAAFLVDRGVASPEHVDRAFRNDTGSWSAIAGPFRWIDMTGGELYARIMKSLMPELRPGESLPQCMQDLIIRRVGGIKDGKGFYPYQPDDFSKWMEVLTKATHSMQMSARGYLREVVRDDRDDAQLEGE
jgi:3-hydroxybutyryl-CoA dehydrogenase